MMINRILLYITIAVNAWLLSGCSHERVDNARTVDAYPPIFPDYVGVTVPVNIAPLNFCVEDTCSALSDVVIRGNAGEAIHLQATADIDIPIKQWRRLLEVNRGDSITVAVSVKTSDGWLSYKPFGIYVSTDSIDYGLVYRLVAPGYEKYSEMGIYCRDLGSYDESAVFENTQVDGCLNCHSFKQGDPSYMSMHVRGPHGGTMLRTPSLPAQVYNTKIDGAVSACVYPYWHPGGRYVAYSTNDTRQVIHATPGKQLEVFDLSSDVGVYDTMSGQLVIPPTLACDSVWETFPAFSPDGGTLYFTAARAVTLPDSIEAIRYSLCSVSFDQVTGAVGEKVDTLVDAPASGRSAALPRPSYDGRFVVYTLADYGTFPIWHPEADLWLLDLATGETRPLAELNSPDTESYHSFSSNSRWMVFGSRRLDGRHTRPYIAHISADGRESKPFLLPQRYPRRYYDNLFRSYNIPEFVTASVSVDRNALEAQLNTDRRVPFAGSK